MKIGILAYGSLITSPGPEIEAVTSDIVRGVETPFPVEFARSSTTRGGAPTLVPVDQGARVAAHIYTVNASENDACDILYRREIHAVGTGRAYREPRAGKINAVRIERFTNFAGHDLVLSTRIGANIEPLTALRLAELAIGSARTVHDGRDGISYLIAAKRSGIVTALSPAYEEHILERMQARDLEAALAAIQQSPDQVPWAF